MKLNENFLVHEANGETILISVGSDGFSGMVRGNATLGRILTMLKQETTEEDMVKALTAEYPEAEEAIRRDVSHAVNELRKIGAIDG